MWKIPRENWSIARTMMSCAEAEYSDMRRVTGGRNWAIAWNGEEVGHWGSDMEKGEPEGAGGGST